MINNEKLVFPFIGMNGLKRSGKDEFTKLLSEEMTKLGFDTPRRDAFADPIKRIMRSEFGFTSEQTDGNLKEKTDPFWKITPRKLMQLIGTEMFRLVFRPDVWVRAAELRMRKALRDTPAITIVFADVRFPNEADLMHEYGGLVVNIRRGSAKWWRRPAFWWISKKFVHKSEHGIPSEKVDVLIDNNGSLEDLRDIARVFAGWLGQGGGVPYPDDGRIRFRPVEGGVAGRRGAGHGGGK